MAYEREVAEWIIGLGGRVSCRVKSGKPFYNIGTVSELPPESYFVSAIHFNGTNADGSLPNMKRVGDLSALKQFSVSRCLLDSAFLEDVRFGRTVTDLRIQHTDLKTSDLKSTMGLEDIRRFLVGHSQIDDQYEFLAWLPNLIELTVQEPTQKLLIDLANSPHFRNSEISHLKLLKYKAIDESIVETLQTLRPDLTIIGQERGNQPRYLGVPVLHMAVNKLIDLGCTIKVFQPGRKELVYSKENRPSKERPFAIQSVALVPGLRVTTDVVSELKKLPLFFGLMADGVLDADLLANVEALAGCAGLHFRNSDLSDVGFSKFARDIPDVYFNIQGTEISQAAIEAAVEEFPLLSMHSTYGSFNFWKRTDGRLNRPSNDD